MKLLSELWLLQRNNQFVVKLIALILVMGLAFRLTFFHSNEFSPNLETLDFEKTKEAQPPVSVFKSHDSVAMPPVSTGSLDSFSLVTEYLGHGASREETPPLKKAANPESPVSVAMPPSSVAVPPAYVGVRQIVDYTKSEGKCDIFTGDWIPNPSGPVYTNESCPFIESPQDCMKNGRPDLGYLYWRWHPRNCELPPLDPRKFLDLMRNKRWAMIGDSISRNHVQSLLCMLSPVEKAVFVYHDEEYRSKGWHFPTYNFTISVLWSPFLLKADVFEDNNGVSNSEIELHLDKLDNKWTNQYEQLDYMIISTGQWFLKTAIYHENGTVLGCHSCPKRNLTELGFDFAYRKALRIVLSFIATSNHKGLILFRTSAPDHFENAEWYNGGSCERTLPVKEGEIKLKSADQILRDIELAEFARAAIKAAENGVNLKLLDLTNLALLRPDGHPGPYRFFHPFAQNWTFPNDCLHWCLPGPIDSWNDVIMQIVANN